MKLHPLFLLMLVSGKLLSAESYPKEFADFFAEREENINFVIAGETRGKTVKGLVTHDSFKLVNNEQNKAQLRSYLQSQYLNNESILQIENTLLAGVSGLQSCEGILSLCVPKDIPDQAEFIFDIDAKQLKTFVSSDLLLTRSTKAEYYDHARAENAFINHSNLYAYKNRSDDASFTWTNNAVLGLPLGHLSFDSQYRSNDNDFDVYEALYDLEMKNVRTLIGYQDFNRTRLNSTDFLGYGADLAGTAFTIGSSQNLLKGGINTQQRIYFYAPEAGQLEIFQGERLLVNRTVSTGQQSISYDELPTGVYNITIVIRRGDEELLREQRQVVNNTQFSLPINSFDYRFEAGYLDKDNLEQTDFDNAHRYYWRGALSYRAAESLLLGSAVINNKDSLGWQIGGYWSPTNYFHLQLTNSIFDKGASYQYAQVNLHPFSASIRKVNSLAEKNSLSSLIYGDEDFLEWGVSTSGSILGGTGYISYYNYQYDDVNSSQDDYQTWSTSWSRELFGGNFSVNFFYNQYKNSEDSWSTNLTWSKSFGDNFSMRLGGYSDNDENHSLQTAATLSTKGERWQASTTAGFRAGDDTFSDISGSLSGHIDYANYSAYAYASDEGSRSISGSVSSTQVISKSGVKATHKRGDAFVSLEPKLGSPTDREVKVNYQFLRNGKPRDKGLVKANSSEIIAITPYQEIDIYFDAESSNAEVSLDNSKKFMMPGMHYQVETTVTPLESQLVVFSDAAGQAVEQVQCVGDGCRNIEMISDDGVYRINYLKGQTFSLAANGMTCPYDPTSLGQQYISSSCSPDIQIAKNNEDTHSKNNKDTHFNNGGNSNNQSSLVNFGNALTQASEKKAEIKPITDSELKKIMVRVKELQNKIRAAVSGETKSKPNS